jgi:hypothetical protein
MTLGNLDNEVIFKKAFADKVVFKAFVRDVLNLDVEVAKIETEKRFDPKIGYIDFELDIFAETIDKRIVIEIQRVEYDHNFDRFLHYFLMAIAEQQKRSKEYGIEQTVYLIVVLTAPYKVNEKNGEPVLDEVLLLKLNPQTIVGEERNLYGHQLLFLNPNYRDPHTPRSIRDWLELIYQSIHNPEEPTINEANEGVRRAAELISFENLTPEERTLSKNNEAARVTLALEEKAVSERVALKAIRAGLDNALITTLTSLTDAQIDWIRANEHRYR